MIDTSIEKNVSADKFPQRRPIQVLGKTAITSPVVRDGAAAMRDNKSQSRKILEQIGREELHKGCRVGVNVMRTGCMEVRIARRADMNHRRHIQLHHLFIERVPVAVGERWGSPVAAGRIRIQIAPNKAQLLHAALEFSDAVAGWDSRRLRQLANADEIFRIQRADAMDQIVAVRGPVQAGGGVADVVGHG